MRGGSSASAATTLGTLGSVSALVEVMLSNSFGKVTDARAQARADTGAGAGSGGGSPSSVAGAAGAARRALLHHARGALFWLAFSSSLPTSRPQLHLLAIVNSRVAAHGAR